MEFPKLQVGQYAVLHSEVATGIVLRIDGQRHLGQGDVWRVFEALDAAQKYAESEVHASPRAECAIFDSEHQLVETVRAE